MSGSVMTLMYPTALCSVAPLPLHVRHYGPVLVRLLLCISAADVNQQKKKDLWSLLTWNLSKSGASNVIRACRSLPLLVLRAYLCVLRVGRLIKNDLINVCSLQFSLRCINIGKHGVESCVSLSNQIVSSFYTSVCPFPRECPFREEDYSKGNK